MDHLQNSVVRTYRLTVTDNVGNVVSAWAPVGPPLDRVSCRLDMSFVRPGKDQPPPIEAGRAPDRIGILFCAADVPFKAGDLIEAVPNSFGEIPVAGRFQIRVIPDVVQDYSSAHHLEIQIIETAQQLQGVFGVTS